MPEKQPKKRITVGMDRVMAVATQMFLRYGYLGTSMKALAQELGTSAPALYWYFPSKEDLYIAVLETSMKDFTASVSSDITASDAVGKLSQFVRAHVTWQLNQSEAARTFDLANVAGGDIPVERFGEVRRLQIEYRDAIRRVLSDGVESRAFVIDNVNVTASTIITLCEYVHTWFNPTGKMSSEEIADALVELVLNMVNADS